MTISSGVDVLTALRDATASRHHALDSGLPLAAAAPDLADYAAHLHLLRAWRTPLHAWLSGYTDGPQGPAGLPATRGLALIDADLADPSLAHAPLAKLTAISWPHNASPAYRWGVSYVIEGSQLGGAVLYQRLHERLSPHPLRYLRGEPDGPGPRWRAFMLALRAHVRDDAAIAQACAGACDAFDAILALSEPVEK
jgi:heme oxygenase (biliverdin-IX-beta and delta-forming)